MKRTRDTYDACDATATTTTAGNNSYQSTLRAWLQMPRSSTPIVNTHATGTFDGTAMNATASTGAATAADYNNAHVHAKRRTDSLACAQQATTHQLATALPATVQSSLLMNPMRIRKSIYGGYQVPNAKAAEAPMYSHGNAFHSTIAATVQQQCENQQLQQGGHGSSSNIVMMMEGDSDMVLEDADVPSWLRTRC